MYALPGREISVASTANRFSHRASRFFFNATFENRICFLTALQFQTILG
jgi:hypothetical protein